MPRRHFAHFAVPTLLALAAPASAFTLMPGSTADLLFKYNTASAVGLAPIWGPPGLPLELSQVGHVMPILGPMPVTNFAAIGIPDPPFASHTTVGPTPFGIAHGEVSDTAHGISFGPAFLLDGLTFGSFSSFASEMVLQGHVVLKNTAPTPVTFYAGTVLATAGFALKPDAFCATGMAGSITVTGSPTYTPSMIACYKPTSGAYYFGDGGLGPPPLPGDIVANYSIKTLKAYMYYGVRLRKFTVPAGGTITMDGGPTHIAHGGGVLAAALSADTSQSTGGSGSEDFYAQPFNLPTLDAPMDGILDSSIGSSVSFTNSTLTSDWGNPNNWNSNAVPVTGDNLLLEDTGVANGGGILNMNSNRSAASLTFFNTTGTYTVNGAGFTLNLADNSGNASIANWSDSNPQINTNIVSPGNLTLKAVSDAQFLSLNGAVAAQALHFTGAGTVNINGPLNTSQITCDGPGTLNINGPQNYIPGAQLNLTAGQVNLATDAGPNLNISVGPSNGDPVVVHFHADQHIASLNLQQGASAAIAPSNSSPMPSHTLVTQSLTIAGSTDSRTAALDIADGKLVVEDAATHTATLANMKNQAAFGRTSGLGIVSSTANPKQIVVVVDNAIAHLAIFGSAVTDAGSVLAIATYPGDLNLDQKVDINDLNLLAAHWQHPAQDWSQGDLNSDGVVNINDLNILGGNWQAGGASFADALTHFSMAPTAPAPEPASLAIVTLGLATLSRRSFSRSAKRRPSPR